MMVVHGARRRSTWSGRLVLALGLALVSSCAGDERAIQVDATDGEELFTMRALGGEPGCVTCHSLSPDVVLVGPSLADPAASAASAGATDSRRYLHTSIVDPTAHVVPGFADAKQMPTRFADILTDDQLDAVVDYLLEVQR